MNDLAFEWTEDNHSEFDIDIRVASPMTNQAIRGLEDVVETDAKADFGHYLKCPSEKPSPIKNQTHLVGVLLVDLVFELVSVLLPELEWRYLHQIRNRCLHRHQYHGTRSIVSATYQNEHCVIKVQPILVLWMIS